MAKPWEQIPQKTQTGPWSKFEDPNTQQEDKKLLTQKPEGVSFLESVNAGVRNLGGATEALKAGVYDTFGNEQAKATAIREYENHQQHVAGLLEGATDWRDIVDSESIGEGFGRTLEFIKEQFGLNSPQMAAIITGGLGGSAIAPNVPHPFGFAISKAAGFTLGATGAALPMFTGFNISRQLDEGKEVDLATAAAYAIPQAATEAFLSGILTKTGLTALGSQVFGEASEYALGRVGQKVGELFAVGIPAEVVQQGFERAAADLETNPWESEEAFNEYLDTAIASAAALSPFGAIALAPKTGGKSRKKEDTREMLEESAQDEIQKDFDAAPEPKQNIVQTPEEAAQALSSIGIDPTRYSPEALIKAANTMVDRTDQVRMDFLKSVTPPESTLQDTLQGTTALSPLKTFKTQKTPVPSVVLEQLNPVSGVQALANQIEATTILEPTIAPEIDLEASGEGVVSEATRVQQKRNKSLRGPNLPTKPTISNTSGAIVADLELMSQGMKKIFRNSKPELIRIAKEEYKIPDAELKDKQGKYFTKPIIEQKVMEKRFVDFESKVPEPITPQEGQVLQQPLERVEDTPILRVPENSEAFLQGVALNVEKPFTSQLKRIASENKVSMDLDQNFLIDEDTKKFKTPIKAAQAANTIFTAINFNNVVNVPDMTINLHEVFEQHLDTLTKGQQETLFEQVEALGQAIDEVDGIGEGNIKLWTQVDQGKREILSHAFARMGQARRVGDDVDISIPTPVLKEFSKIIRTLERSQNAAKGLEVKSFEDMFDQITPDRMTPRGAIFDSVERLRNERLQRFSDALQFEHWKGLDNISIKELMTEYLDLGINKESMKKTGLYARSKFASAVHLASKNPVFAVAQGLVRERETAQANYLTQFSDAGEKFLTEPSKEVRYKAADVLDHLRNTKQRLERNAEGQLVFVRDGKQVIIQHPEMVAVIESLDSWGKSILKTADGEVRTAINDMIDGTLIQPIDQIKRSVEQVENDKALDPDEINFLKEQLETLENLERMKQTPFVPHMRFGSYGFTVHAKKNLDADGKVKPGKDPVFHSQVEEGSFKKRWNKKQYKDVQTQLEQYRNDPKYKVYEDKKEYGKGYEMTYSNVYDKLSQDAITLELITGLIGSDKTEQYYLDVKNKLDSKTKYRGFKKKFGETKNVEGYSKDWDRVIGSYSTGSAHFFAKARYAPLLDEYGTKVDSEVGETHRWLKNKTAEYIDYNNSPHDEFQNIRTMNFLWTMGGNFSTAALQVMTLPTTTLGSMMQYDPNLIKNSARITKFFKMGMSELSDPNVSVFENGVFIMRLDSPKLQANLLKRGLSPDAIQFLQKAFHDGRTGAGLLEENVGGRNYETRSTQGTLKDIGGKFSHILGTPISAMEQATRFATLLAHYDMFTNNPQAVERAMKVLKNDYRFQAQRKISDRTLIEDLAYFGMDEAHAVFGKTGRGELLRGGFGTFLFPFMTYPQNAVEFMGRMMGRGREGKQAMLATAGALFLFSGLMGLPGGELAKELLEEVYKATGKEEIDLDYLIREKLTEATGDPRAGMFVTQGMFRAFLNMDVSKRIGLPILGQDLLLAGLGVRGDMSEIAGVQGSMATNAVEAWRSYGNDESSLKVASHLTPVAVSNILKAFTYYDEGVKTRKGTQLVTPEDIQENTPEFFARLVGITTGRIASAREEQYWRQVENNHIKPKMNSFRTRGKGYVTKQARAIKSGNVLEAEKWRKKYLKLVKEVGEYLNKKKHPYDIKAFHKSILDSVDQRLVGGVRLKDLNKAVKHRKGTLSKVSGKELFE